VRVEFWGLMLVDIPPPPPKKKKERDA